MGFSRQEQRSGLPFPPPGDLPDPGIELASPALAGRFFTTEPPGKVKVAQLCPTLCDPMDYNPWNSPGQNTAVGSLSLLQGIFPTQGSNPSLLHCKWMLYQLSYQGSPPKNQASLNFMAAVTVHSDFGAQENKVCHCFHFTANRRGEKWKQ